jgi:glycosyltransferase involved in cell wall biosynthesis
MKFTIVTPSYQQGLYLERTIQSVLNQVGPNVEVEYFILDNCSTDSTVEVLKKYEYHASIHIIRSLDRGQADAINSGWGLGTGDIFAWLNADDIYLNHALESVEQHFTSNPDIHAIYGEAVYLDADDCILKPVTNIRDYSKWALRTHDFITQPATFLRRSVIQDTGELSLKYRYGFDWDYWIRVSERYDFVRVKEVLAGYRVTGENLTTTGKGKRFREMLRIVWRYGALLGLFCFGLRLARKYAMGKIEMPTIPRTLHP